ncbi:hypothetical protein J4E86_004655 [Alternaria arbusti]|uniref:uncharacterized protein n=1 Tax=Alternaria arbusti TaxID=232088 RepID=UPI00221EC120|nr:uncharacterized protein J4E86_004655 [Alternaria arbusti]KAI4957517.1 hypothetical protein J4E86_004655 [Alternaria arbusti]
MTSSESEQAQTSRKRSRRRDSVDDGGAGGKKARGRPRVDTQDATAADRRRTQIRLAQRAYRQRKETTIASLKNQSTQLHSIIEQMNKAFLKLNESTVKSGLLQLNPSLAQEFKLVTETFASLTKTANEGQYEGDEDGEHGEHGIEGNGAPKLAEPEPEVQHIGWGYSAVPKPAAEKRPQPQLSTPDSYLAHISAAYGNVDSRRSDLVGCRQFGAGAVFDQSHRSSQPPADPSPSHTSSQPTQLPFGLVDLLSQHQPPYATSNLHTYSVRVPTPEATPPTNRLPTPPLSKLTSKTLPPVTTYSFQETTFARRLSRAALEAGFHLLSNAQARPTAINRVFKLSLPHETLDQIRSRFRTIMARGIDEDLDWWESPFLHLGGAGTHYPRRDAAGNVKSVRNGWNVRQIGPTENKVLIIENTEDGRSEELRGVDLRGYEGEWFDCYDVQGYLEEKYSCKLDPKSSFAECVIDVDDEELSRAPNSALRQRPHNATSLPPLHQNSANASAAPSTTSTNPPNNSYNIADSGAYGLDLSFGNTGEYPRLVNYEISYDQTLGLDLAPGYDYGFSHTPAFHMDNIDLGMNMMSDVAAALPVVRQKRKKTAWLDVSKLIDGECTHSREVNSWLTITTEIIIHGVCLGRSPGYRRKDVDAAVQKALVHDH